MLSLLGESGAATDARFLFARHVRAGCRVGRLRPGAERRSRCAGSARAKGRSRATGSAGPVRPAWAARAARIARTSQSERACPAQRLLVGHLHPELPRERSPGQRLLRSEQKPGHISQRAIGVMRGRAQSGGRAAGRGLRRPRAEQRPVERNDRRQHHEFSPSEPKADLRGSPAMKYP
jgi:hypothetical protein